MPKTIITANAPVDEGSQNAATATPDLESTKPTSTTPQEAAAATESDDAKTHETLTDSSATASEHEGIDWKAASRKWERQSKENLRRVEELMESINSKDATVEELRAQVKAFEHTAQVDEWKAQVGQPRGDSGARQGPQRAVPGCSDSSPCVSRVGRGLLPKQVVSVVA